jgi:hypothetical protein
MVEAAQMRRPKRNTLGGGRRLLRYSVLQSTIGMERSQAEEGEVP